MVCSILAFLSLTVSWNLPKFMKSITSVMPSSHLILWRPLLLPSTFPSIRDFPNKLAIHIRWPKYWIFSFLECWRNIHSFQWIFRVDFDWLIGSLCCPRDSQESSPALQFEGINSLALSLLYSPALPTICDHWEDHSLDYTDLCRQRNVSAFQLSRFVIAFLPKSNRLLISWLQSSSSVILEPKKR